VSFGVLLGKTKYCLVSNINKRQATPSQAKQALGHHYCVLLRILVWKFFYEQYRIGAGVHLINTLSKHPSKARCQVI
jgi:hypothetical protein